VNTLQTLKVIQQEDPDVLLMQETYCCGMDVAREAGYSYSWRGSSNLSIHSKYPITDTIPIFKPFNSHVAVIDVHGRKLLFANLWLHYLPDMFNDIKVLSPDSLVLGEGPTRLKEITAIMKAVDSLEAVFELPVIIGGDFNSASHLDWTETTREFHYGKVVPWPVSLLMERSGYVDSYRVMNPDLFSNLDGTWGFLSDAIISDRIDYIYFKGSAIRAVRSKIVMDDPPGGFFNSDHRAVITEFELDN
jgi:exonuclease III